jgi:hypothetical protein
VKLGTFMELTNEVLDVVNIVAGVKAVARKLGVPEPFVREWMVKGTMKSAILQPSRVH